MVDLLPLAVTVFALGIGSIIALKFRVPPLVIFLLMGLVIGAYGFLQQNSIVSFLGQLGSILLLFAIGTEFSIYKLIRSGIVKEMAVAIIEIAITMSILFVVFAIWLSPLVAMLLALAFSITSTGVSLKLLQELSLFKKIDVPLIVKVSVIEDLITVFAFTLISSFSTSGGQPIKTVLESFAISLTLFIGVSYAFYVFFNKFLFRYTIREEDLLMLALGLLLLLVSISGAMNLSTSFGAYLAGSIVSSWRDKWKALDDDLRKFSYIFISFFFLTAGISASLHNVNYLALVLLIPLVLVVKFVGVFFGSYAAFRSSRTSIFTSLAMLSRGELTLVIVSTAVSAGLLAPSYLGMTALVVFVTVFASYFLLKDSLRIYMWMRVKFPRSIINGHLHKHVGY